MRAPRFAEGAGGPFRTCEQALNAQAKGLANTALTGGVPHWREALGQSAHRRSKCGIARVNLSGKADSEAAHGCTVAAQFGHASVLLKKVRHVPAPRR